MNLKKLTIALLTIILCIPSISAERMSRCCIAVLQSNGYWKYRFVSDSDNQARTEIIDPKDGYRLIQDWSIEGKSGETSFRIKGSPNYFERVDVVISGFNADALFNFRLNRVDFATIGSLTAVWHSNDFIGLSLCINFVMSDDVTEKYCIETFLNEERIEMIRYFKDYPVYSIPYE